jgi:hypothetical protein
VTEAYLDSAARESQSRFAQLKSDLDDAGGLIAGRACVYATGSFGRLEAGAQSDLDLFIVVTSETVAKDGEQVELRSIDGIDEIKLKHYLISAVERQDIAPFDGGGKYLAVHTISDFTKNLGSPEDDSKNTFTGRLLMLLESRPLLGDDIYNVALGAVIEAYFKDYEDNKEGFVPAFLFNDILRMWRTFCVNYEYYRKKSDPKSKVKLFKLKYIRMLTCYSAIAYLLSVFARGGTVSPADIRAMVGMTPTERLRAIGSDEFSKLAVAKSGSATGVSDILRLYSEFLEVAHKDQERVANEFVNNHKQWRERSHDFATKWAELLEAIEIDSAGHPQLYRFVLI